MHPILNLFLGFAYFFGGLEHPPHPNLLQQSSTTFRENDYYISMNPASFKDARKDCETHFARQGRNGTLLYLESQAELRFILQMLEDYGTGRSYWIGGKYVDDGWVWTHDGSSVPSYARPTSIGGTPSDRSRLVLRPINAFRGEFLDRQDTEPDRQICKAIGKRNNDGDGDGDDSRGCDITLSSAFTEEGTNRVKRYFVPSQASEKKGDWEKNYAYCKKCGGEMVSVMSPDENIFLHSWLRSSKIGMVHPGAWLGAQVKDLKLTTWNNGRAASYQSFCPGEPDQPGISCLNVGWDARNCWLNYWCTLDTMMILCQKYQ